MSVKSKKFKRGLVWLRRDLRLSDNRALYEAIQCCDEVIIAFVFDVNILSHLKNKEDRRVTFIVESLKEIDENLTTLGSSLLLLKGDPVRFIPEYSSKLNVQCVFVNKDYEGYAKKRDLNVEQELQKLNIQFFRFKDQVVFEGSEIKNLTANPYKVFTPYKKQWLQELTPLELKNYMNKDRVFLSSSYIKKHSIALDYKAIGFLKSSLIIDPGEKNAQIRLESFLDDICDYHLNRDFPACSNGTSGLSVHLRFGTLSIRSVFRKVLSLNKSKGVDVWISELIWREFYQMILDQFPHVEKECFKREYNHIKWPGKKEHFLRWCKGQTGYPIIDAAMRSFNQTGWMHNRLRMIVASFLVKDLLLDWRLGEAYFAENLLDFELASNNGGWQWCASTGCDAQPYFRVFNPITQSKKFDKNGEFILRHCPELKQVKLKDVHWPHGLKYVNIKNTYPAPIVDHAAQRIKAIKLFQK